MLTVFTVSIARQLEGSSMESIARTCPADMLQEDMLHEDMFQEDMLHEDMIQADMLRTGLNVLAL